MIKNRKEQLQQHDKSMWVSKTLCKLTFFWAASFFFFSSCFFFFLSSIKWFSFRIFASFHSLNKRREGERWTRFYPKNQSKRGVLWLSRVNTDESDFVTISFQLHGSFYQSSNWNQCVSSCACNTCGDMWSSNKLKSVSSEGNSFDYHVVVVRNLGSWLMWIFLWYASPRQALMQTSTSQQH